MHQPVTFDIPSIGYTIVDNGTNPDAKKAHRQAAAQTARRVAISTIAAIAEKHKAYDLRRVCAGEDGRQTTQILVRDDKVQAVLDTLQGVLGA